MDKANLQMGDVVMIVDPQLPRALWPVRKISEVHSGADDRVRSATVQVERWTYTRPVARIVKLPAISDKEYSTSRERPLSRCTNSIIEFRGGCSKDFLNLLRVTNKPLQRHHHVYHVESAELNRI